MSQDAVSGFSRTITLMSILLMMASAALAQTAHDGFFTASDGVKILPEKTHLTAIAVGGPMPQQYIDAMRKFIDAYDDQK